MANTTYAIVKNPYRREYIVIEDSEVDFWLDEGYEYCLGGIHSRVSADAAARVLSREGDAILV